MKLLVTAIMIITSFNFGDSSGINKNYSSISGNLISKIKMNLDAFAVESDNFPSIRGVIDFDADSSYFEKSYYYPAIKGTVYKLTHNEIEEVLSLLQNANLANLKQEYRVKKTDQPVSTITIFIGEKELVISDYGLEGEYPLPELYKLCYKF
jgi:hypothetical protein